MGRELEGSIQDLEAAGWGEEMGFADTEIILINRKAFSLGVLSCFFCCFGCLGVFAVAPDKRASFYRGAIVSWVTVVVLSVVFGPALLLSLSLLIFGHPEPMD